MERTAPTSTFLDIATEQITLALDTFVATDRLHNDEEICLAAVQGVVDLWIGSAEGWGTDPDRARILEILATFDRVVENIRRDLPSFVGSRVRVLRTQNNEPL